MDAITMLKDDHKTVEQLFKRFEKAGDRAVVAKRDIVDRIIEELSVHAAVEEQLFYPVVRATVPDTEDLALESLEEHHIVKWVLSELESMSPEDERFDAKVTVLIENVRHHVEEEEGDLFPMVRDELGRNALTDLGDAMAEARKSAPTHPHPRSPDTPPGNLVIGTAAGVADRIGDALGGVAQGSVAALGDVIALVLQRKAPQTTPSGSSTTRRTARTVRAGAADATDTAIATARKTKRTARSASSGARRTARAATSGAKGTATSARRSSKQVAATAKRGATTTGRTARSAVSSTRATAGRSTTKRSTARSTAKRAPAKRAPAKKAS